MVMRLRKSDLHEEIIGKETKNYENIASIIPTHYYLARQKIQEYMTRKHPEVKIHIREISLTDNGIKVLYE